MAVFCEQRNKGVLQTQVSPHGKFQSPKEINSTFLKGKRAAGYSQKHNILTPLQRFPVDSG